MKTASFTPLFIYPSKPSKGSSLNLIKVKETGYIDWDWDDEEEDNEVQEDAEWWED